MVFDEKNMKFGQKTYFAIAVAIGLIDHLLKLLISHTFTQFLGNLVVPKNANSTLQNVFFTQI